MNSCLYECAVMHHRLSPKQHRFSYRIFMFYLDLDEIDSIARRIPFFGRNRRNIFAFNDTDHLDDSPGTVKEKLIAYLAVEGIALPESARVMLLTLPRVLGYVFNPVSFYFCFDPAGAPLCAVAEVGNTFREKKLYLLSKPCAENRFRLIAPKHFYVSPFSELDLEFDFKLRVPAESLDIHVDDRRGEERILLSALTGRRAPLTAARLAWFGAKYPLVTLWIISLIHWNALLLWLKRVPFHRKEARPDLQRNVLHPHPSITPTNESPPFKSRYKSLPFESRDESPRSESRNGSLPSESHDESLRPESRDQSLRPESRDQSLPFEPRDESPRSESRNGSLPSESRNESLRFESRNESLRIESQNGSLPFESRDKSLPFEPRDESPRSESRRDCPKVAPGVSPGFAGPREQAPEGRQNTHAKLYRNATINGLTTHHE